MKADVIIDLQYGDCGKGKVTHALLKNGSYTHCMRYNGSGNAGHTIYHNGEKIITHYIPAGVFFGVKSIIGPGCAVHPQTLLKEIEYLKGFGIEVNSDNLKIAYNTHLITDKHLEEDGKDTRIGTTRRGNGPAFRDKYDRVGVRAESHPDLEPYIIDIYTELQDDSTILMEGAQGFYLDPDWGDYPYVTSSNCTVASAIQNGIPYNAIRKVYGVAKAYITYVGARMFQTPGEPIFNQIRELGKEYGATTGRPRQVNWLDTYQLVRAIKMNGVTDVIINKMDILDAAGVWFAHDTSNGKIYRCGNGEEFKDMILSIVPKEVEVKFSYTPYDI